MVHAVAVFVVSAVPALAFLVVILALDRREPEPIALVLGVMALGGVSAIVAAIAELGLQGLPPFSSAGLAGAAAVSFLQVAPVEEGVKLAVALLENIIYVVQDGLGAGAARAVSAVPLHVFTGVLVGLHVGLARFAATRALRTRLVLRGFALAWFVHGLYDRLAMSGNALALLLLPLLAGPRPRYLPPVVPGSRTAGCPWSPVRCSPSARCSGFSWSPACGSRTRGTRTLRLPCWAGSCSP